MLLALAGCSGTPMMTEPLKLGPASLPEATRGTAYSQTLTATGGSMAGHAWSVSEGALPSGIALTSSGATAELAGTPDTSGSFTFTIRVQDGAGGSATQQYTLVVRADVPALEIETATLAAAVSGSAYTAQLTGRGGSGAGYAWSISAGDLPAGLTLAATGTPTTSISGTPTASGSFTFTVRLADSSGATATRQLTLVVNGPVQLTTTTLPDGTIGTAYDAPLTAAGGTGTGYTWQLSSGMLPPGLSFAATGTPSTTLSGTPTMIGTFNFTVRVTDSSGAFHERAFTTAIASGIVITTTAIANPIQNVPYNQTIASTGTGTTTWSVSVGALPAGIVLTGAGANATLTGTATTAGPFAFTLRVASSAGFDEQNYSGTVSTGISIAAVTPAVGVIQVAYTQAIASIGGSGMGHQWSVSAGTLPPGLSLTGTSTATVTLSGTPTMAGSFPFTLQVTDSSGGSATQAMTVVVNDSLSLTTMSLPAGFSNTAYSATLTAAGGTGAGYTWSVSAGALPMGLTLAASGTPSSTLSGTPTATGTFNFTITVTDSGGGTASRALTLDVTPGLAITTTSLAQALQAAPYSATLAATGGTGAGYAWTVTAGALPAGLTLAPSGTPSTTLSGTPTAAGTFNFTVTVTDSAGSARSQPLSLVVAPALAITTMTFTTALVSTPYTATVTGIGGSGSGYAWSVTAGALPGGLTLAPTGTPSTTLSGTPTAAGSYSFTLRVTDSTGAFAERPLTLTVNPPLQVSTTSVPDAIAGVPYSQTINSTGGTGAGQSWTLVSGSLPPGLGGLSAPSATRQLASWSFTGVTGATSPVSADVVDPQVQAPVQIFKVGLGSSGNTGEYGSSSWTAGPTFDPNQYYRIVIAPLPGGLLNLTRFETRARASAAGTAPNTLHVRSSRDNFTTTLFTIPLTTSHVNHFFDLPAADFSNLTSAVEFRIYASGATSTSSTLWTYLDDTRLHGNTPVPATGPSITLSGTPTTPGTYTFTVRVTDSSGASDDQTYTLNVGPALQIVGATPPVAVAGAPYSMSISSTGGTGTGHAWSVSAGALPGGLTLGSTSTPTATLSGTPTTPGMYGFTLRLTDSSGVSVTQPFNLVVNDALSIVTMSLANAAIGVPYSQLVTAGGGAAAGYGWQVTAGALPAGLSLSAQGTPSATLAGTPTASGSFTFTLQVTDAYSAVATRMLTLVVGGDLAILTTPTLPAAVRNAPYTASITGIGGTGAGYTWQAPMAPAGLALAPTGTPSTTLSGTPTAVGSFTFDVTVTDSAAATAVKAFTVDVLPEIELTATTLPQPVAGGAYTATLTATGGTQAGFTWALESGALPPGLTLATTGTPSTTLTGTPTAPGMYTFAIRVTDSNGQFDTQSYSVTVLPGVDITTTMLSAATIRRGYAAPIAATGGSGTGYTWSVTAGSLPPGLTLATSGTPATQLSGAPTAGGSFTFTVRVVDSAGSSDTQSFTLAVSSLEILPAVKVDGTVGAAFSQTLTGAGGSAAGYSWAVTEGALPPGLSLGATGTPATSITGTPTTAGAYLFTVTLTDSAGATAFRRYAVDVRRPQRYAVGVGDEFTDAEIEPVIYDLSATPPTRHRILPNGMTWPTFTDALTSLENFRLSPDNSKLAFVADAAVDGSEQLWVVDLSSGPQMGTSFIARQVSSYTLAVAGDADVTELVWSPDSTKLAWRADADLNSAFELYLSDVTNPAMPGAQVKLSPTATTTLMLVAGSNNGWAFSPDSRFVAFRGDYQLNGRNELYATYVGPGSTYAPFLVNAPIPGTVTTNDIDFFWWAPAHPARLVYLGQPDTASRSELVMADVSPTGVTGRFKLNGPLVANGNVSTTTRDVEVSPDGTMVFYIADQDVDAKDELYVVDISGPVPGPPVKMSPNNATFVATARWSPASTHIAYVDDISIFYTLFVVGVAAPQMATQVSPSTLASEVNISTTVFESPFVSGSVTTDSPGTAGFTFSPDGTKLAFVAGTTAGSTTNGVLLVAPLGGTAAVVSQVGVTAGMEVSSYVWAPDSSGIAYVGDLVTSGVAELFHVDLAGFPMVQPPIRLNRTPVASGGDVVSASVGVYFYGPNRVAYRADERIDVATEVVLADFSNRSAVVHAALSNPATTSAFSVTNLRVQGGSP